MFFFLLLLYLLCGEKHLIAKLHKCYIVYLYILYDKTLHCVAPWCCFWRNADRDLSVVFSVGPPPVMSCLWLMWCCSQSVALVVMCWPQWSRSVHEARDWLQRHVSHKQHVIGRRPAEVRNSNFFILAHSGQ